MQETVYLEDPSARISNAWLVFRRGAYRVEDVQSVTLRTISSKRNTWHAVLIMCLSCLALVGLYLRQGDSSSTFFACVELVIAFFAIISVPLAIIFIVNVLFVRPQSSIHLIVLRGTFGSSTAYASLDKEHVERVMEAIHKTRENKVPPGGHHTPLYSDAPLTVVKGVLLHDPYWSDGVVALTQDEVWFGDKAFLLSSIKSASVRLVEFSKVDDLFAALTFIAFAFWAIPYDLPEDLSNSSTSEDRLFSTIQDVAMLTYLIMLVVQPTRNSLKAHVIELSGTFGRVNTFVTLDGAYADAIVKSIKQVVKQRNAPVSV